MRQPKKRTQGRPPVPDLDQSLTGYREMVEKLDTIRSTMTQMMIDYVKRLPRPTITRSRHDRGR